MVVKLDNSEAKYFIKIFEGQNKEQILNIPDMLKENQLDPSHPDTTEIVEAYEESYKIANDLFKSIKLFENVEVYSIDAWGYEQTNYENITVIGSYRNAVIAIGRYIVYSISKSKYMKREPANLDVHGIRSTTWDVPYTSKEMADQRMENAYFGH